MLQQVVDLFGIDVDADLSVMQPNQTLAGLTARLVERLDGFLEEAQPDMVLVQGDTTTVLVGALTAFYRGIPVGHVEAGLRTGNIRAPFPEEANRRLVSPLVDLHFAPTGTAEANLLREGTPGERIVVTGNTVIDALQLEVRHQRDRPVQEAIDAVLGPLIGPDWRTRSFVLITGHRRENFGAGFAEICSALGSLAVRFPDHRFVYPVHLNPNVRAPVNAALGDLPNVVLIEPQDYRCFVALMGEARLVLTDSGGVQEEAPGLGKPVLVMRETTERPEGVDAGTVRLVGARSAAIIDGVSELLTDEAAYGRMAAAVNPYGDGHAAGRIVDRIRTFFAAPAGRRE
jgi:UDP-N-acetylglucosamine 2-epimerase (non-hydrolysing)